MKFGVQIQAFENSSQTIVQNSRGIGHDYEIWSADTNL